MASADDNPHLYIICFQVCDRDTNTKYYGSKGGESTKTYMERFKDHRGVLNRFNFTLLTAAAFNLLKDGNRSDRKRKSFEKFLNWLGRIETSVSMGTNEEESQHHKKKRRKKIHTGYKDQKKIGNDGSFFEKLPNLTDTTNRMSVHHERYKTASQEGGGDESDEIIEWKREASVCTSETYWDKEYAKEKGCIERLRVVQSLYHADMMFSDVSIKNDTEVGEKLISFCKEIDGAQSLDDIVEAGENLVNGHDKAKQILENYMKDTDSYVSVTHEDALRGQIFGTKEPPKMRHCAAQKKIEEAQSFIDGGIKNIREEVKNLEEKVAKKKKDYEDKVKTREEELQREYNNLITRFGDRVRQE